MLLSLDGGGGDEDAEEEEYDDDRRFRVGSFVFVVVAADVNVDAPGLDALPLRAVLLPTPPLCALDGLTFDDTAELPCLPDDDIDFDAFGGGGGVSSLREDDDVAGGAGEPEI